MRHHRLLPFFDLRRSGFDSAIDEAFSEALSFIDRRLLVRDKDSVPVEDGGSRNESASGARGAEVGAGPRDVEVMVSYEETDRVGESSVGVEGTGEPRSSVVDIRGLCIADGATEGAADG
jgi:hypothetical protein